LNMLLCGELAAIIPVHILLRVALECSSIDQLRDFVGKIKPYPGTCSAVVVASKHGNFLHYEFMNDVSHELPHTKLTAGGQEVFFRTNHFLTPVSLSTHCIPTQNSSTWARFTQVEKNCLQLTEMTITSVKMVLQDPIVCQPWIPFAARLGDLFGTVVVVVMDLINLEMHFTCQQEAGISEFKKIQLHEGSM